MVLKFGAKQRHVIIIVDAVYYATTASQCDRRCQVCAERNSCARGGARRNVCKCDAQSLTFCLAYITQRHHRRSPRSVPCRAVRRLGGQHHKKRLAGARLPRAYEPLIPSPGGPCDAHRPPGWLRTRYRRGSVPLS